MKFTIITTAALPWLTGTSINPLLRAAYLSQEHSVELVLPACINPMEAGPSKCLDSEQIREKSYHYISTSLPATAWRSDHLSIRFYDAVYQSRCDSIYPQNSLLDEPLSGDILILQDPLQLLSRPDMMPDFRQIFSKPRFKQNYKLTLGILDTNNFYFIPHFTKHVLQTLLWVNGLKLLGRLLLNRHFDCIVNLSPGMPSLHKYEHIQNVNGVHDKFLQVTSQPTRSAEDQAGCYYLGKLTHLKHVDRLLALATQHQFHLNLYGRVMQIPPNLSKHIQEKFDKLMAQCESYFDSPYVHLHQPTYRPEVDLAQYKTLINLSESERFCTTTAEALAMGKFVVIPDHPSNQFFKRFKNACFYQTEAEAMQQIRQTAASIPQADPLVKELAWPEANKRLLQLIERVLSHGSLSS
ncbi:MAG: hypothetical protein AAFY72_11275 [Cyanobacteria bacterium J06649_4]